MIFELFGFDFDCFNEFFFWNVFNFGKIFFEVVLALILCNILEIDFSNTISLFLILSF